MRELDEADYERLMRAPPIRDGLAGIEARRQAAMRRFWIILPTGAVVLAGIFYFFYHMDLIPVGAIVVLLGGLGTWVAASWRLMRTNDALKEGIFAEAGRIAELRYRQCPDDHRVMTEAQPFLFTGGGTPRISDLFEGELDAGRKLAFFEMGLSHETGTGDDKKTVTDFAGQMFAFTRPRPGEGVVAARPRQSGLGGLLSRSVEVAMPGFTASTRSVEHGDDPPFDSAFDILASNAELAREVLGPEIRRLLLELRARERVWFYCGPKNVLVGIWGEDRFEGGGMFRRGPIEHRIRSMVDDLNESVRMAERLVAAAERLGDDAPAATERAG